MATKLPFRQGSTARLSQDQLLQRTIQVKRKASASRVRRSSVRPPPASMVAHPARAVRREPARVRPMARCVPAQARSDLLLDCRRQPRGRDIDRPRSKGRPADRACRRAPARSIFRHRACPPGQTAAGKKAPTSSNCSVAPGLSAAAMVRCGARRCHLNRDRRRMTPRLALRCNGLTTHG